MKAPDSNGVGGLQCEYYLRNVRVADIIDSPLALALATDWLVHGMSLIAWDLLVCLFLWMAIG